LQADSVEMLRDLKLLTEDSFLSFPFQQQQINRQKKSLFEVFYRSFLQKMQQSELLPSGNKFVSVQAAYLAESRPLLSLFSGKQLAVLVKKSSAQWVFPNLKSTTDLWHFIKDKLTAELEKRLLLTIDLLLLKRKSQKTIFGQ
jgi:hypothetical protein